MSDALVDALTDYAAALVAEVHAGSVPAGATEAVHGTVAVLRSLGASVDAPPPLLPRLPPPRAVLDAYDDAPMARRTRLAMVAVFEAMRRSVPCDVPEDAIEPGTWLHPAAGGAIGALQSHVEAAGEEREEPSRVVLRAPTGAGKTHLLLELMVRSAMPATMAGGVIFFVVPNRATVRQVHRRLMRLVVNEPWYREGAVALYTDPKATLSSARIIMTTYASLDRWSPRAAPAAAPRGGSRGRRRRTRPSCAASTSTGGAPGPSFTSRLRAFSARAAARRRR
jgi:Type III restriction enzyme, res subunit